MRFDPPGHLTFAFTALTAIVVVALLILWVGAAPPVGRRRRAAIGASAGIAWLALHAAIASSGALEGAGQMPPPLMLYAVLNLAVATALALSPIGCSLATAPLGALVGLQAFRLPLEVILHQLHEAGQLPVQMTWSGYNFDVITGVSAAALGLVALRRPLPRALVWGWNILGSALLAVVVAIAMTSAPTPFRQFTEGPPVVLPLHVPWNWIVNVHVATALVGHLVIFRALLREPSAPPGVTEQHA